MPCPFTQCRDIMTRDLTDAISANAKRIADMVRTEAAAYYNESAACHGESTVDRFPGLRGDLAALPSPPLFDSS